MELGEEEKRCGEKKGERERVDKSAWWMCGYGRCSHAWEDCLSAMHKPTTTDRKL